MSPNNQHPPRAKPSATLLFELFPSVMVSSRNPDRDIEDCGQKCVDDRIPLHSTMVFDGTSSGYLGVEEDVFAPVNVCRIVFLANDYTTLCTLARTIAATICKHAFTGAFHGMTRQWSK